MDNIVKLMRPLFRSRGSPTVASATAPEEVSAVVTSCGRPDLLEQTLTSFFSFNSYPIAKFIIVEDGVAPLEVARRFDFRCDYELLCTGERVGQIAAIDYAYSRVRTPYIFHLEDDWLFHADGFIEKSMLLLKLYDRCLQVYIRAVNDTNGHPISRWRHQDSFVAWRKMKYGYKAFGGEWNGFSFNPGLRRLADYTAIGGYGVHIPCAPGLHASTEIALSKLYRKRGMFAAILTDRNGSGYVSHIGWNRTVSEHVP
jgi:hypothetical protein